MVEYQAVLEYRFDQGFIIQLVQLVQYLRVGMYCGTRDSGSTDYTHNDNGVATGRQPNRPEGQSSLSAPFQVRSGQ